MKMLVFGVLVNDNRCNSFRVLDLLMSRRVSNSPDCGDSAMKDFQFLELIEIFKLSKILNLIEVLNCF